MSSLPEPRILKFTRWLAEHRGLGFDPTTTAGYDTMWRWSVNDLEAFWGSVWAHFDIQSPTPYARVLAEPVMPGARWFEGAQVNYARQVLRHADAAQAAGHPAIVFQNERMRERGQMQQMGWDELRSQVASLALALRGMGVRRGDRVCAFLPNTPHTIVAFLAAASVGAIWSVCSPDMGPLAVLDRFRQIEPTVLIGVDGYVYGGVEHDRLPVLRQLLDQLPSVRHAVLLRYRDEAADVSALGSPAANDASISAAPATKIQNAAAFRRGQPIARAPICKGTR